MDDHDKGLAHDLDTLGRRRVLLGAAGLEATTLLTAWGCGGGASDSSDSSSSSSSSGGSSGSSGTCAVSAEETQGPYPSDGSNTINGTVSNALALTGIVRSDIRTSFGSMSGTAAGVPVTLKLAVVNANASCADLAGYAVYVWHCDRDGEYSLYGATNQNYLRGVQETDVNERMKALLGDTLFKRLFALMWLALGISHAVAFLVVTRNLPGGAGGRSPTFPSLPPVSFGQHDRGPGPGTDQGPGPGGPGGPSGPGDMHGPGGPQPGGMGGPPPGEPPMPSADAPAAGGVAHAGAIAGAQRVTAARRRARRHGGGARDGAGLQHDLRTPLTRIRMRLEASEGDPLTARSIADIHEMDDLIESALEVFRGSGLHEEPSEVTDVHALVQAIADDLADLGQPVSVSGETAPARVQAVALRRVVANLVNNALRYGKRAQVSVQPREDAVVIVIEDEGPGIPEAQLEAVMKPFYRIRPAT